MADTPSQPSPDRSSAGMTALASALKTSFRLLLIIMVIAIVLFLRKSFFAVEQHEVGLVLRFGQLLGQTRAEQVLEPGLHVTLPYPIDEKVRVPAKREQIVATEGLWYGEQEGESGVPPSLRPGVDGYSLTGDMNILHSRWELRYTITGPVEYAFAFVEDQDDEFGTTRTFLRHLLNSTVTEVSASLTIDEAWNDRKQFQDLVEERMRQKLDQLNLGIDIQVLPRDVVPPRQVNEAFEALTRAGVTRKDIVGQATAYRERTLSEARSEENRLLASASSERDERVRQAESERAYFYELLPDYQANPGLVKEGLFTESMRRVLSTVDNKFIIQDKQNRQLRLELNREPDQQRGGEEATP